MGKNSNWLVPLALAIALIAGGCSQVALRPADGNRWTSAAQAVPLAAAAEGRGVDGVFALTVQASGMDRGILYLNSERDYRDQRNLSVAIAPAAQRALAERFGAPLEKALQGKRLLVTGQARRVRIDFTHADEPTGKYYYQTHVQVTDPDQLQVL